MRSLLIAGDELPEPIYWFQHTVHTHVHALVVLLLGPCHKQVLHVVTKSAILDCVVTKTHLFTGQGELFCSHITPAPLLILMSNVALHWLKLY